MRDLEPLHLGPEVVQLLIPQRHPLRMVDGVLAIRADGPRPALRTFRNVSANEPVFEGHFPGLPIWPGVFTLEGIGQSCQALSALLFFRRKAIELGFPPSAAFEELGLLHRRARLQPVGPSERFERILEAVKRDAPTAPGVTAAVDVKFLKPIFAGDRIEYVVELAQLLGALARFDVTVEVEKRVVAKGFHTAAIPGLGA